MTPVVERLAASFAGRADIVKIDVDRAGGELAKRVVGATSESALAALIESQLASAPKDSQHIAPVA